MGSDDFFKKRKGKKKEKNKKSRLRVPYRYLIVCEGGETEPNYLKGIKQKIEDIYRDKTDIENKIEIHILGTGRNTEDLVKYTKKKSALAANPYGNIWVVFDKDDFSDDQFNSAIDLAEQNGIRVAWSNESVELWFLLHFNYLGSAIHRNDYYTKLNEIFKKENINNGKYEKNLEDIFDKISTRDRLSTAIKNSQRLRESYTCKSLPPSKMNPCTTMDILVEELIGYLEG